jgi:hypothetical protein
MTDLEKLAQWHEAGAVCEVRYDNAEQQRDHHSAAAATIRAAMGEIERTAFDTAVDAANADRDAAIAAYLAARSAQEKEDKNV